MKAGFFNHESSFFGGGARIAAPGFKQRFIGKALRAQFNHGAAAGDEFGKDGIVQAIWPC